MSAVTPRRGLTSEAKTHNLFHSIQTLFLWAVGSRIRHISRSFQILLSGTAALIKPAKIQSLLKLFDAVISIGVRHVAQYGV
jgi:hypothetical protein